MEYKFFSFGKVSLVYGIENNTAVFTAVPKGKERDIIDDKMAGIKPDGRRRIESAMQVATFDNLYSREYTAGKTHRNKQTAQEMGIPVFLYETIDGTAQLTATYSASNGLSVRQTYVGCRGGEAVRTFCSVKNTSDAPIVLENVPSLNVCKLSPFVRYNDHADIWIHSLISNWSGEGRVFSVPPTAYGLEESWCGDGLRTHKFGQVGSIPANGHLPWLSIEDKTNNAAWAFAFEAPSSWQIEVANVFNGLSVMGGQADYTFGHWKKQLSPNETFTTHAAYFTAVNGNMDQAAQALVRSYESAFTASASEKSLPVIYNEYCYSWGVPSLENVQKMLPVCKKVGCETFVVDAGWYCPDGKMWWSVGDWTVNERLFPGGLKAYAQLCKSYGLRAGVWFEFESVSADSDVCKRHPDWLLTFGGAVIRHDTRHMLDFRKKEVVDYLTQKVIQMLLDTGITYLKVDYNETIGLGVDGAESPGEGLRAHTQAVLAFFETLRRSVPNLVLEICASGGMRHEPRFMALGDMSSFSDAHEGAEGAVIACDLHRFIPPAKLQIWAVIRGDYTADDTYFTLAKSMLGRICLSGDLSPSRPSDVLQAVTDGTAFYQKIKDVLRCGETIKIESKNISALREIHGVQFLQRVSTDRNQLVWYCFIIGLPGETATDILPEGYRLSSVYGNAAVSLSGQTITAKAANAPMVGCVALLSRR